MPNLFFDDIMGAGADDAPFLRTPGGVAWTYADMRREAARMAAALAGKGLEPGDRVAAQIEKSPRGLMLYLGTLMAGGIFLPLNTGYTTGELEYFLGDAEPAIVVCDPGKRDAIARIAGGAQVETLDAAGHGTMAEAADAATGGFAPVARTRDDLAAILYTSGTTGRSKGAMLTHDNLVSNARALADIWRFASNDVLLHALPIYHTHGLFVACNTTMCAGASLIFLPKFEPVATASARSAEPLDGDDGGPNLLHAPARSRGFHQAACRADAPVHVGLGAAARGDASRLGRAHRATRSSSATA